MTGAGAMGRGLFYQFQRTPGIRCVVLSDIDVDRAVGCARSVGLPYRVVESVSEMEQAINDDVLALSGYGHLASVCEQADVFLESTNSIAEAGSYAMSAIDHGMHLVLMNAEIDLIFGPLLLREARRAGLTYTSCDGDQHGVIKRIIDEIQLWGFDLVMAGNIKGFLDRTADPTSIIPEADKRNLDYRMCTAYTDGTKLAIEMALLANALDLRTAVPGMHGPRAPHADCAIDLFDLDHMTWREHPVIDYLLGAEPGGGVFVVGYCDDSYQRDMMAYYKMGPGPYFVFTRPYHLCHVEAVRCIAEAHLDGFSLLEPKHGFRTNVFAYGKKNLKAGERLDGLGGHTAYGLVENTDAARRADGVPICLADDIVLRRDLPVGTRITTSDVVIPWGREDWQLYKAALGSDVTASA
jgi:predicted homoserine dehydrogenase-like protein